MQMSHQEINKIILGHIAYEFPSFMLALRGAVCVSRWRMAREININHVKIFLWEMGDFFRPIKQKYVDKLADYLGVPRELFTFKMLQYSQKRLKELACRNAKKRIYP